MKRKLMALSALTCIAGGTALMAPASAQVENPSCESMLGQPCWGRSAQRQYTPCSTPSGGTEYLFCYNGTWHQA